MKKSELKTGDQLTFRNGRTAIVLLGTRNGDIYSCIGADGVWGELLEFNEDLTHKNVYSYDVVKVSKAETNMRYLYNYETIWEREEAPEYVELLHSSYGYKKGDVAKVVGEYGDGYRVFVPHRESTSGCQPNVWYWKNATKPSTKEAYESQTPEYVELLHSSCGYKKGDVAKVVRDLGNSYEVFVPHRESTSDYKPYVWYWKNDTKPSTKQAYKAQVPEYVELLCDTCGYKKGDIAKVIRDFRNGYEVFVPHRESTSGYKPNVLYSKMTTKPSTKEAYESQTPEYTVEQLTEMIGHNFKIKK